MHRKDIHRKLGCIEGIYQGKWDTQKIHSGSTCSVLFLHHIRVTGSLVRTNIKIPTSFYATVKTLLILLRSQAFQHYANLLSDVRTVIEGFTSQGVILAVFILQYERGNSLMGTGNTSYLWLKKCR